MRVAARAELAWRGEGGAHVFGDDELTLGEMLLAMAKFAPYESELEDTDQNTEAPSESHAQEAE